MPSANRLDQFLSEHARNREEVTIDAVEIALVHAGISIDYATRVNDCGTNIYLEGGGILCLYDSGRLLLQGKPTSEETALFKRIIDQSKSGHRKTQVNDTPSTVTNLEKCASNHPLEE